MEGRQIMRITKMPLEMLRIRKKKKQSQGHYLGELRRIARWDPHIL